MAIQWDSIVPPEAITAFVRQVPVRQDMILNQILPDRYIGDTEISVDESTFTLRAARYRAFDAPPQRGRRDIFSRNRFRIPPISQVLGKGEVERLNLERVRNGGGNNAAVEAAIYDDAEINTKAVLARAELARGDVLDGGDLSLSYSGEPGLTADYGVPAGNKVTAAVLWSHTTSGVFDADILGNLRTWTNYYRALNGFSPGGFWCSEDIVWMMLQNAGLKGLFAANGVTPAQITTDQATAFLRNYRLPGLNGTYDSMIDVDGTATRPLPNNKLIFTPPAGIELGFTFWGLSATALELVKASRLAFRRAPGIAGVVDVDSSPPYKEDTFVDATVLPAITNPKALMIATVA